MHLVYIVGIEPTIVFFIKMPYHLAICATYCLVPFQLLNDLLNHPIQHHTCLSSADYSTVFHDHCQSFMPTTIHTAIKPLFARLGQYHYPFSYQLTIWFCSEVITTCYSPLTQVPFGLSISVRSTTIASLLSPPVF